MVGGFFVDFIRAAERVVPPSEVSQCDFLNHLAPLNPDQSARITLKEPCTVGPGGGRDRGINESPKVTIGAASDHCVQNGCLKRAVDSKGHHMPRQWGVGEP